MIKGVPETHLKPLKLQINTKPPGDAPLIYTNRKPTSALRTPIRRIRSFSVNVILEGEVKP
jgi:hypothetical protein